MISSPTSERWPSNRPRLSRNALVILKHRYLRKDATGRVIESPNQLLERVARNIAQAEQRYDPQAPIDHWAGRFYTLMAGLKFLPNSPTLMNAGRELQQLSACFVLPVADSLESIFDAVKQTALIHQSGGGTGFSFSQLRPKSKPCSAAAMSNMPGEGLRHSQPSSGTCGQK